MGSSRGVDRRTLIKGAAAAGVAVWTAPVILDSLSSPAAAASVAGCRKVHISVFGCATFPSNPDAWATTCDTGLSSVSGTCGQTIASIPVDLSSLATLGITRTSCGTFATTLRLSATNCSWVAGQAHSTVTGCHSSTAINNAIAGNRTITFPVGGFVDDYYLVTTCT